MTFSILGLAALLISAVAFLLRESVLASIEFGTVADWVSGIATFAAVWVALNANGLLKSQRDQERQAQARMNAEQVSLKLIALGNDLMALRRHVVTRRRKVSLGDDRSAKKFDFIDRTFGLVPEAIPSLTPSEASELIAVDAAQQASNINLLCKRLIVHQNTIAAYSRLVDDFDALTPRLTGYNATDGLSTTTSQVDEELALVVSARLTELQASSDSFEQAVTDDLLQATSLCEELAPFLKTIVRGQKVLIPDTAAVRKQDVFPKSDNHLKTR